MQDFTKTLNAKLKYHIKKARSKHKDFPIERSKQVIVLVEEVGEVCRALLDRDRENYVDEIYDTMVVLIRMLEHESQHYPLI